MMYKIGIGITTHNRPDVLRLCVDQFAKHHSQGMKYVIVDDNSRKPADDIINDVNIPIDLIQTSGRVGVARAKNLCLKGLLGCDYFFLFDDDCYPISDGWADWIIEHSIRTKQNHFIYNLHGALRVMRRTKTENGINIFAGGAGVMMFMTKKVIDTIGGYNTQYGVWGHEHNGYSHRIKNAGLNDYAFMCPNGIEKYIYSLDMSGLNALAAKYIRTFTSSEPHELRRIWANESRGRKALEYDVTHNYYQPL